MTPKSAFKIRVEIQEFCQEIMDLEVVVSNQDEWIVINSLKSSLSVREKGHIFSLQLFCCQKFEKISLVERLFLWDSIKVYLRVIRANRVLSNNLA